MRDHVFLIHEDRELRADVERVLRPAGLDVRVAPSLEAAHERLAHESPCAVLLPWSTEGSVREALVGLKAGADSTPRVVVLAPRIQLPAAIGSLAYGADDCIGVPFAPEELLARITAALGRPPVRAAAECLEAGPILLDKNAHVLTVAGERVELAPAEFRLLAFFLGHQGRVFSRSELLKGAWARHVEAGPRTVDVHVRRLRQVLEPFGCDEMIQTVRGFGYRFGVGVWPPQSLILRSVTKLARS